MDELTTEIVDALIKAHSDAAWAMAEGALATSNSITPLAVAMNMAQGEINMIPLPGSKEESEELVRHVVTVTQADFVLMVAEASMLKVQTAEEARTASPSDDPRSKDVVIVRYRVKGQQAHMIVREIISDGYPRRLGDVITDTSKNKDMHQTDSLFSDIFERPHFMKNARRSEEAPMDILNRLLSGAGSNITLH